MDTLVHNDVHNGVIAVEKTIEYNQRLRREYAACNGAYIVHTSTLHAGPKNVYTLAPSVYVCSDNQSEQSEF